MTHESIRGVGWENWEFAVWNFQPILCFTLKDPFAFSRLLQIKKDFQLDKKITIRYISDKGVLNRVKEMMLSQTCNYGIRATLYIATQTERTFVPVREISQQLGISFHFLTKILQILTRKNILTSYRGPNGGVGFALPPENISLKDVIIAIDGAAIFEQCILGLNQCSNENPCPLHSEWKNIRTQMEQLFQSTSLASLAGNIISDGFRITNLAE